jgi:hypothetical protein
MRHRKQTAFVQRVNDGIHLFLQSAQELLKRKPPLRVPKDVTELTSDMREATQKIVLCTDPKEAAVLLSENPSSLMAVFRAITWTSEIAHTEAVLQAFSKAVDDLGDSFLPYVAFCAYVSELQEMIAENPEIVELR